MAQISLPYEKACHKHIRPQAVQELWAEKALVPSGSGPGLGLEFTAPGWVWKDVAIFRG